MDLLVRKLGLASYRWLPGVLFREFCREAGVSIDETLPHNLHELPWDLANRKPKRGENHHEDLERNVTWWYRKVVKGDLWKAIERDYIRKKSSGPMAWPITAGKTNIKNGVERVKQLLGCVHQVGVGRAKDVPLI